jgi:hypothetical protein
MEIGIIVNENVPRNVTLHQSRVIAAAGVRVLLHIQRKGDSGSPRVSGSIKWFNTSISRGSFVSILFSIVSFNGFYEQGR